MSTEVHKIPKPRIEKNHQIRGQFLDPEDEGFDNETKTARLRQEAEQACRLHVEDLMSHHRNLFQGETIGQQAMRALGKAINQEPALIDRPVVPTSFKDRLEALRASQHTAIDASFDLQLRGAEAADAARTATAAAEIRVVELESVIDEMKRDAAATVSASALEISRLEAVIATIESESSTGAAAIEASRAEMEALRDRAAAESSRSAELEAMIAALREDVAARQQDRDAASAEAAELRRVNLGLRQDVANGVSRIGRLENVCERLGRAMILELDGLGVGSGLPDAPNRA